MKKIVYGLMFVSLNTMAIAEEKNTPFEVQNNNVYFTIMNKSENSNVVNKYLGFVFTKNTSNIVQEKNTVPYEKKTVNNGTDLDIEFDEITTGFRIVFDKNKLTIENANLTEMRTNKVSMDNKKIDFLIPSVTIQLFELNYTGGCMDGYISNESNQFVKSKTQDYYLICDDENEFNKRKSDFENHVKSAVETNSTKETSAKVESNDANSVVESEGKEVIVSTTNSTPVTEIKKNSNITKENMYDMSNIKIIDANKKEKPKDNDFSKKW